MEMEIDAESSSRPITETLDEPATATVASAPPTRSSSVPLGPQPDLTVGYVWSAEMCTHFNPRGHDEAPQRILRIWEAILAAKYNDRMKWIPIRPVSKAEALLVHSEDLWNQVETFQYMTQEQIANSELYYEQLSLYVMQGTTRAARLSCGGAIEAFLAVARGHVRKAFAIIRPPGHHAEPDHAMGFCFFNNVAVATRVTQKLTPIKKIMILDWDVHHGNGTQKAFNDDPSVLYISLHRYDAGQFYPGGEFGGMQSCGEGPGLGYSVNIPWPEKGMGDADYIHAFQRIIMPIAMEFAPQMVIISAGFDAALGDPLGECRVSPAGYAHMTHMLSGLAGGRLVVALEGGYDLDATTNSALAVAGVILGESPEELPPLVASEAATETVWLVAKEQSKYWKCINPKACEPREDVESITFSIPEILKAHRQHYLFTTHEMMQVPLLGEELEQRYSGQILCTKDIFENSTMVVFVHELGNLRTELESSITCNVSMERSYLVDCSRDLINWVRNEGYSLLDINLFSKPYGNAMQPKTKKSSPEVGTDAVRYLWDNYVQLSGAKKIILIGHGPGCQPLLDLIDQRYTSIVSSVKAVIQVVGHNKVPMVPKRSDELRAWYWKHSYVVLPSTHYILSGQVKEKQLRRHGSLHPIDESQPIKLMTRSLPNIQEFIKSVLAVTPEQPTVLT